MQTTKAMRKLSVSALIITFLFSVKLYGQGADSTLIFGLEESVIYKISVFDDYKHSEYYSPKYKGVKFKPSFLIRSETQTGVTIRPAIAGTNGHGIPVAYNFWLDETAEQENFLQIGLHDFDNDKINEIVIAYGVRGVALACLIYKYHEPANISDASRDENWEEIGQFQYGYHDPRFVSSVEDSQIGFPFGSQGASERFVFVAGKFVKFQ